MRAEDGRPSSVPDGHVVLAGSVGILAELVVLLGHVGDLRIFLLCRGGSRPKSIEARSPRLSRQTRPASRGECGGSGERRLRMGSSVYSVTRLDPTKGRGRFNSNLSVSAGQRLRSAGGVAGPWRPSPDLRRGSIQSCFRFGLWLRGLLWLLFFAGGLSRWSRLGRWAASRQEQQPSRAGAGFGSGGGWLGSGLCWLCLGSVFAAGRSSAGAAAFGFEVVSTALSLGLGQRRLAPASAVAAGRSPGAAAGAGAVTTGGVTVGAGASTIAAGAAGGAASTAGAAGPQPESRRCGNRRRCRHGGENCGPWPSGAGARRQPGPEAARAGCARAADGAAGSWSRSAAGSAKASPPGASGAVAAGGARPPSARFHPPLGRRNMYAPQRPNNPAISRGLAASRFGSSAARTSSATGAGFDSSAAGEALTGAAWHRTDLGFRLGHRRCCLGRFRHDGLGSFPPAPALAVSLAMLTLLGGLTLALTLFFDLFRPGCGPRFDPPASASATWAVGAEGSSVAASVTTGSGSLSSWLNCRRGLRLSRPQRHRAGGWRL